MAEIEAKPVASKNFVLKVIYSEKAAKFEKSSNLIRHHLVT